MILELNNMAPILRLAISASLLSIRLPSMEKSGQAEPVLAGYRLRHDQQHTSQLKWTQIACQFSAYCKRNDSCLLGYDNDNGVSLLRNANGSTVPGSESSLQVRTRSQRKQASRGNDSIVCYDDATIMERAVGVEQSGECFGSHQSVKPDSSLDIVFETCLSLHADERPDPVHRQVLDALHNLVNRLFPIVNVHELSARVGGYQLTAAKSTEHPPQLRLEDHDKQQGKEGRRETAQPAEHAVESEQPGLETDPLHSEHEQIVNHETLSQLQCARVRDQSQDGVEEKGCQGDVDDDGNASSWRKIHEQVNKEPRQENHITSQQ